MRMPRVLRIWPSTYFFIGDNIPMHLTLAEAKNAGYNEIFFSWNGLGDTLAFLFGCQKRYEATGKKILVAPFYDEFFTHSDACDIITEYKFSDLYHNQDFLEKEFSLHPIVIFPCSLKKLNSTQTIVNWPQTHILGRTCEKLGVHGNITLNPSLYLSQSEKEFGRYFKKNQIAIMSTAIQQYKNWGAENFQKIVNHLHREYNFIQIGSPHDVKLKNTTDMRGKVGFRKIAAILYNSDLFCGNIGGLMHLAKFVNCDSVIAYSNGEPLFYDSYINNTNITPKKSCNECAKNNFDPQHQPCKNNYSCVKNISVNEMVQAIKLRMHQKLEYSNPIISLNADPSSGLEDFEEAKNLIPFDATVKKEKKFFKQLLHKLR